MDFVTQQQQHLGQLASRFNLVIVLVVGLLLSNVLSGSLAWYTALHQKIEVTPFNGASGYHNSVLSLDPQYLTMMTENLIYARLNVTPETVRINHKHLLSFADEKYYPKLLDALNKEARAVSTKKSSSYFEIKEIKPESKQMSYTVVGKLKRATGARGFHEEPASYHLTYRNYLGRLVLSEFTRLDEPEAVSPKRGGHASKKQG